MTGRRTDTVASLPARPLTGLQIPHKPAPHQENVKTPHTCKICTVFFLIVARNKKVLTEFGVSKTTTWWQKKKKRQDNKKKLFIIFFKKKRKVRINLRFLKPAVNSSENGPVGKVMPARLWPAVADVSWAWVMVFTQSWQTDNPPAHRCYSRYGVKEMTSLRFRDFFFFFVSPTTWVPPSTSTSTSHISSTLTTCAFVSLWTGWWILETLSHTVYF